MSDAPDIETIINEPTGRSAVCSVRNRVLILGFALYGTLFTAFAFSGMGSAGLRRNLLNGALIPVAIIVMTLMWSAAHQPHTDQRARRGWLLFFAANIVRICGVIAAIVYRIVYTSPPAVALDDVLSLSFYPLCFLATLHFVSPPGSTGERARYWLDSAIIVLGSLLTVWYFLGQALSAKTAGPLDFTVEMAYLVGDLILVPGIFALLAYGVHGNLRTALVPLAVSVGLLLGADMLYIWASIYGTFFPAYALHSMYIWAWLFVGFAAWRYCQAESDVVNASTSHQHIAHLTATMRLAAIIGAHGLLLLAILRDEYRSAILLLIGAMVMTLIVIVRQHLASRENARLLLQTLDMSQAMRLQDARFRALVKNTSDIILQVLPDGTMQFISPSVTRIMGYTPESVLGHNLCSLLHRDDIPTIMAFLRDCAQGEQPLVIADLRFRHVDGSWRTFEAIGTNMLNDPDVDGIIVNARDVTDRVRTEDQLRHHAFHDALTGLPNRILFTDRLEQAWTRTSRRRETIALLFIDVDRFKAVNDTYGHEIGDQLLVNVSQRIVACLRSSDTVTRIGGDEFAIILDPVLSTDEARGIAERIIEHVRQPLIIQGHAFSVSLSIGIVLANASTQDASHLLRRADAAMYQAKNRGRGRAEVYDPEASHRILTSIELNQDIDAAVEQRELEVSYQPIVDIDTGHIRLLEALVRWNHPVHGLLSPAQFIPASEESGHIIAIGHFVLHAACAQLRTLRQLFPDAAPDGVSVNVSAQQLARPDVLIDIADALAEYGLQPADLLIEITERDAIGDFEQTLPILQEIHALGVQIAIDDFGTGHSSLASLSRLPVDMLKIDRAFLSDDTKSTENLAIVRSIVTLARDLNLEVVGEGVETRKQAEQLRALHCDLVQGYYYSPPLTTRELYAVLHEGSGVLIPDAAPAATHAA